jgi:hypothetical protein
MDEPFASGLSTPPEKSETSFLTSMEFLIQLKKSTLGGEAMRGGLEAVAGARKFCFGKFFDEFYSHHIDESKRLSDVP